MTAHYDENLMLGYLEGELSPQDRARFERQMQEDPRLRNLVAQLLGDRQLLRSFPAEQAPADLLERIQPQLERRMLLDAHPAHPGHPAPGSNGGPLAGSTVAVYRFPVTRWLAYGSIAALVLLSAALVVQTFNDTTTFAPAPAVTGDAHRSPPTAMTQSGALADAADGRSQDPPEREPGSALALKPDPADPLHRLGPETFASNAAASPASLPETLPSKPSPSDPDSESASSPATGRAEHPPAAGDMMARSAKSADPAERELESAQPHRDRVHGKSVASAAPAPAPGNAPAAGTAAQNTTAGGTTSEGGTPGDETSVGGGGPSGGGTSGGGTSGVGTSGGGGGGERSLRLQLVAADPDAVERQVLRWAAFNFAPITTQPESLTEQAPSDAARANLPSQTVAPNQTAGVPALEQRSPINSQQGNKLESQATRRLVLIVQARQVPELVDQLSAPTAQRVALLDNTTPAPAPAPGGVNETAPVSKSGPSGPDSATPTATPTAPATSPAAGSVPPTTADSAAQTAPTLTKSASPPQAVARNDLAPTPSNPPALQQAAKREDWRWNLRQQAYATRTLNLPDHDDARVTLTIDIALDPAVIHSQALQSQPTPQADPSGQTVPSTQTPDDRTTTQQQR